MATESIPRLDNSEIRKKLLPLCRLARGEIWEDPEGKHRVGVLDAASKEDVLKIFSGDKASLFIQDPPYNI